MGSVHKGITYKGMIYNGIVAASLAIFSSVSFSQGSVAGSYSRLSADDVSFGVVSIHGAYEFRAQNSQFSLMPEIRLGTGVQDDTFSGIKVEIDEFQVLALRLNYYTSDTVAIFLQPSYARLGIEGRSGRFSASSSDTEFGLGLGASLKVADDWSVEASYERFDDTDVLSAVARYHF